MAIRERKASPHLAPRPFRRNRAARYTAAMSKLQRPWTVLPHDRIERLEDNLWVVEGDLPDMPMPLRRRMAVARLADGRLCIHNAIALDEDGMRDLEAWGRPALLIVPNGWHRLDAHAYKTRYPDLVVLAPRAMRRRVEAAVPVDGDYTAFPADPDVRLEHLDGLGAREGVLIVRSGLYRERTTLCFADALFNLSHLPGFWGFVYRLLGSSGGPRMTRLSRLALLKDERAFAAHLRRLAEIEGLSRLVVAHGNIIHQGAPEVLRAVADRL